MATLDLLDVTRLAVEVGVLTWAGAERYCGVFSAFSWLPDDWVESGARDTVMRRRYPTWLTGVLEVWRGLVTSAGRRPSQRDPETEGGGLA